MNSRTLFFAAALVGTLAAGFFAGRMSSPAPVAPESQAAVDSLRRDRPSSGSALDAAKLSSRADRPRGTSGRASEIDAEMRRIMGEVDPLLRAQQWLDFVNTLDPAEFEAVVADFRAAGLTRENMAEYEMLLTAWAKTDPLSALEYAAANTGGPFARNTILASWAASDPEAAISWAQTNHDGDGANPFMVGVIRGLAPYNPERANQLLGEMPYSRERGEALNLLLPRFLEKGPEAAKEWALAIDDDRLRGGAIARLAERLAADDPAGAADWLLANPGDGANRALDDVMSTWVNQDESAAIAFYDTIPSGELRSDALRGIANRIADRNPAEAAAFIDRHVADATDRVYQQFVWNSMRQDPALAANYIGKIENQGEQQAMYRRMLDGWLRRDFETASAWIGSTPLPERVAERLNGRIQEMQERRN